MRPLRLELEGFTCFKNKTRIDFEDLTLFAISGSTGSGKSSLLDAILYALYAQTPRLGSRGLDALIHPQADGMVVVLEFQVMADFYRVIRLMKRYKSGSKQEARVERLEADGKYKQLPDLLSKELAARLEQIVGLDYDSFVRAVLLPQGAFDEFLCGSNSKRIELLIKLLGLERLSHIQQEAGQRARDAVGKREFVQKQIAQDFEGVNAQVLAQEEQRLRELEQNVREGNAAIDAAQKRLEKQRHYVELQRQLERKQQQLQRLRQRFENVVGQRQALRVARAAAKLLPTWEVYRALEQQVQQLNTRYQQAEERNARLEQDFIQATQRSAEANEASKGLTALRERLAHCIQLKPRMAQLRSMEGDLGLAQQYRPDMPAFEEGRYHELQQRLNDIRLHQSLQERLVREQKRQERLLQGKQHEAAEQKNELAVLMSSRSHSIEEGKALRDQLKAQEARLTEWEEGVDKARANNQASSLRSKLQVGEHCPVCGEIVKSLAKVSPNELVEAEQGLAAAKAAEKNLQQQLEKKRDDYRNINGQVQLVQQQLEQLTKDAQAIQDRLEELAGEEQQSAQTLSLEGSLADHQRGISQAIHAQKIALAHGIAQLSPEGDPDAQIARLKREIEATEARQRDLERARAAAEIALEKQRSQGQALAEQLDEQKARLEQLRQEWEEQLTASPFADDAELTAAYMDEQKQESLAEQLEGFDREKDGLEREEIALSAQLIGQEVDLADYEGQVQEQRQRQQQQQDMLQQLGQLEQVIRQLEQGLEKKKSLQNELGRLEKEASVYDQLRSDMQRNKFPEYLLAQVQEQLALRASHILRESSDGRYDLKLRHSEYAIVDSWHHGEARSVKTLSGGESFIASLALALALSETLAGNTALGALFLDEGFGTLDSESLESVALVLENLSAQGRMVGVITHVQALSERLPQRLLVQKGADGSSVRWSD